MRSLKNFELTKIQVSHSRYFVASLSPLLDQTQTPLLTALQACADRPGAPFYAPGHKRGQGISRSLADCLGTEVFRLDLPELPELDNLFAPQGVIQAAQELAAAAFGAEQTWFLANGSTCGVMAAIAATCQPGDQILLPRNVHRSAIAGLILAGAMPIWVEPEYDPKLDLVHSLAPQRVAAALEQFPAIRAVLMVYPTYHGICGDVAAIAKLAHAQGIPLLVDEAHGPHFRFHPDLPTPALQAGADLSVQSIHKVLAALSQAAMLHVQGDRLCRERLSQTLQLLQSTSPSYLLLASLDAARQQMALQGQELLQPTLELADRARSAIACIPGLKVLEPDQAGLTPGFVALDRTRLTVILQDLGLSGFAADAFLHQTLGVTAELPGPQHLTFIISLGNRDADITQLIQGLQCLRQLQEQDDGLGPVGDHCPHFAAGLPPLAPISLPALSPRQAFFAIARPLPISQALGRISAELISPYPPGIPILLPGEVITPEAVEFLQAVRAAGGQIIGCSHPELEQLKVIEI